MTQQAACGSLARRVAMLVVTGLFIACGIAGAGVPNTADIAACNHAAREEFRSRSIAPISKDEAGADAARMATPSGGGSEHATQSLDPQIHGMDAEGARDAAYRAVYRVCMRKRGF
jgi:hypothetical protein